MTTINIYRKPANQYANDDRENIQVSDILEKSRTWEDISSRLSYVADRSNENSQSTNLGDNTYFMSPFERALEMYKTNYSREQLTWCHRPTATGPLVDLGNETVPIGKSTLGNDETSLKRFYGDLDDNPQIWDPSFAQKVKAPLGTKVIAIGDIHSGIFSFKEILDDLVKRGIVEDLIDETLRVKDDYMIFFLGDVVDRGPFGLDILHMIFKLKVENFDRVFYINGNHEDVEVYSRRGPNFGKELAHQLPQRNDQHVVHEVLTFLPSVIFLNINDQWIQLNHGGIEETYDPSDFINSSFQFEFHGYDRLVHKEGHRHRRLELAHGGLRWNDFGGEGRIGTSRDGGAAKYGKVATDAYLNRNGLAGIVRGHQDNEHISILGKSQKWERWLDKERLQDLDMLYVQQDFYLTQTQAEGWERIAMADAFRDFSVITTSTAVRARGRQVGYHTYLELTNTETEVQESKQFISNDQEYFNHILLYANSLGVEGEMRHLLTNPLQVGMTVDIQKQRYDLTIRTFIDGTNGYQPAEAVEPWRFHLLLLHSLCNIKGFVPEERPEPDTKRRRVGDL